MRTISGRMTELWMINERTKANGDIMQPGNINRHKELLQWFFDEAQQGARQVFGKYLDFGQWR